MKRTILLLCLGISLLFTACATVSTEPAESRTSTSSAVTRIVSETDTAVSENTDDNAETEGAKSSVDETGGTTEEEKTMTITIGDTPVQMEWEDNESVTALKELVQEEPLTIQMSMYGGFEQVGSIGNSLPRNDVQTTTSAGDIALYSGSQIVVFYGSNSWAYTRLGRIADKTSEEMADLLGNGDVMITIKGD